MDVFALGIGGVPAEPGDLADRFGYINHQSFNASCGYTLSCLDEQLTHQ